MPRYLNQESLHSRVYFVPAIIEVMLQSHIRQFGPQCSRTRLLRGYIRLHATEAPCNPGRGKRGDDSSYRSGEVLEHLIMRREPSAHSVHSQATRSMFVLLI